jgi:hypothetical protein
MSTRELRQKRKQTKLQRRSKRKQTSVKPLRHPISPMGFQTRGQRKMSEVLLEFTECLATDDETLEFLEKRIAFGVVAWNATLVPEEAAEELVGAAIKSLDSKAAGILRILLDKYMKIKRERYSNDKRLVVEYSVSMTPDGPHLLVASAMPDPVPPV